MNTLPFKPGAARRLGLRRPFSKDDRALADWIYDPAASWSWLFREQRAINRIVETLTRTSGPLL